MGSWEYADVDLFYDPSDRFKVAGLQADLMDELLPVSMLCHPLKGFDAGDGGCGVAYSAPEMPGVEDEYFSWLVP